MARYQVVKGSVGIMNPWLYKFTTDLVACVSYACGRIAQEISSLPDASFGTDPRVQRVSGTPGSNAALSFAQSIVAPHSNAYARHFLSEHGNTARMDLGNLVEQYAIERLRTSYRGWIEFKHYKYQCSQASPPLFPINYMGNSKSARPDIRYEFYSGTPNGDEVVFDITTQREAALGHLLNKRINNTTIGTHPRIPIAVEIIWEDKDLYNV